MFVSNSSLVQTPFFELEYHIWVHCKSTVIFTQRFILPFPCVKRFKLHVNWQTDAIDPLQRIMVGNGFCNFSKWTAIFQVSNLVMNLLSFTIKCFGLCFQICFLFQPCHEIQRMTSFAFIKIHTKTVTGSRTSTTKPKINLWNHVTWQPSYNLEEIWLSWRSSSHQSLEGSLTYYVWHLNGSK